MEIALAAVGMVWLAVCAGFDLRLRQVPNGLTVIPLAGGLVMAASWRQNWPAAVLVVLLILLSDLPQRAAAGMAAAGMVASGWVSCGLLGLPMEALATQIVLWVTWQLWRNHLAGGADAKILMTVTLLYGSGAFLAATAAGGLFGLAALWLQRKTLPYVLPIAVGTSAYLMVSLANA